ncbi:hypothetical protein LR48_Vigan07g279800 [Vigna angularis]|uniref:alpha-amylase n=1 Tax=Phaseolus angularis TaxID=3914 RepID=A0A0L9V2Y2_PHAAN|nr:hypothetical protein LR48_Vigan07g279800 [Vigna angularis]
MKQYEVRSMADIVINHRCGTTKGHEGMYNRFDVIPLAWDEHVVTSSLGGLGNPNTANKLFPGFPIIDHTKKFVRKDILNWFRWLRYDVGFEDFRFDFVRGFSAKYVKEYIEGTNPLFSVEELKVVPCHLSTVKGEFWRLRDAQGKPPGVMGWWASRSVTVLDNHDTGSSQNHWPFPKDHIMEINIRKQFGIKSTSAVRTIEAKHDLYSVVIDEKLSMKIGEGLWCPFEMVEEEAYAGEEQPYVDEEQEDGNVVEGEVEASAEENLDNSEEDRMANDEEHPQEYWLHKF